MSKIRIRGFIHPDSIGVEVYEVERLATNKAGATYWERMTPTIEPFTDESEAREFAASLSAMDEIKDTNAYLQGQKDCKDGEPHKSGMLEDYDRGYGFQYQHEQNMTAATEAQFNAK